MRRKTIFAGAVAAFVLLAGVALAGGGIELPGFLPADDQRPVGKPTQGQQVAVIEIGLGTDGDRVTAEVRSTQVIDNFAPKVVARSGGDWEVRITGEKELRYRIPNPLLDVEVANPDDEENPYDLVPTETLDWTLVVPLYDEGAPLGATHVEVIDLTSEQVIFETDLNLQ